jgi:hypothetical protein
VLYGRKTLSIKHKKCYGFELMLNLDLNDIEGILSLTFEDKYDHYFIAINWLYKAVLK